MRREYLPLVCIALMLLVSAATYAFLPEMMTVHWSFSSFRPDGYAHKAVAVLVLPIIAIGLVCMQLVGRYVSSDGEIRIRFGTAVMLGVPILFAAHIMVILVALTTARPG